MEPLPSGDYESALKALENRARVASLRAEINEAFNRHEEFNAVLQKCAEALVRNLNAAFARVWILDKSGLVLELRASAGLYTHTDGPHGRVKVGDFKIGRIAKNRKAHVSNSVVTDPEVSDPEWARREGMVSFAGYPLTLEGKVLGVVAFFARQPISEEVIKDLESIADGLSQWVKRKQSEREVADQKEWLLVTFQCIGEALVSTDLAGNITYLNPVAETLTGCTSQTALGKPLEAVLNLTDEKTQQSMGNLAAEAIQAPVTGQSTTRSALLKKGKATLSVELRTSVIRSGTTVIGAIIVLHDVTERRKDERLKEEALKQAEDARREAEILVRVGRSLAAEIQLGKVVQLAVDAALELVRAEAGFLFYKEAHDEENLTGLAVSGSCSDEIKSTVGSSAVLRTLSLSAVETLRINDMRWSTALPDEAKAALQAAGFKSCLALRILSRSGSVLGAFLLGHSREWRFPAAITPLLEGIAAQSAIALDNAHLYRALAESRATNAPRE